MQKLSPPPAHVAIIMDGNGRWAAAKKLPREEGHRKGAQVVEAVTKAAQNAGVKYLTLYAFSTENWRRSPAEIAALMRLLSQTLDKYRAQKDNNVRLIVSGRRRKLGKAVLAKLDNVINATAKNKGLTLNLALNYGGRQEIVDAANKLLTLGKTKIAEADISKNLYNNLPAPDLIIRTSGEQRLSNFLLWQAAYSELYFTPVLWPDFDEDAFTAALKDYARRQRRFGK
ncbi:MAG: di-trans,poly-cis-decaprenylcistransferase [Elusimicrobiota bacterium]|jgi:undecaprenyl diphosphate synthase|nr:di-trans,poly-cis-decaprenylcistransferase [Elusimicrobiota bacterium]